MTVELDGAEENAGAVELRALAKFLTAIDATLRSVEREITGDPRQRAYKKILITGLDCTEEGIKISFAEFPAEAKLKREALPPPPQSAA